VPLSDVRFSPEEVDAVAGVYRSGWLSQGPRVAAFERGLAEYLSCREAVAVASGTAALQLILAALRVGRGDEVVLPSLTFAATAAAVVHAGATPVFADICGTAEPWLSPQSAEAAIGPRTRAIIHVPYGGHPGEATTLRELADAHSLTLIEDAAHALGARVGERAVGTFGHLGAFSFFANKNLALGEGGAVVTSDERLASRARLLRSHGLSADTWARHTGEAWDYEVLEPGFNLRLDEPRAALGLLLLGRLEHDNRLRATLAQNYVDALEKLDGVLPGIGPDERQGAGSGLRSAWHIFPLLLDRGLDRRRFRGCLADAGVQTSIHYPPLHQTRAFAAAAGGSLGATEEYALRTVTIPLFPHMTEAQQGRVIEAVTEAVRRTT
jgi:dTDP-4-amino-4,6-dideoxygalactose transaminase